MGEQPRRQCDPACSKFKKPGGGAAGQDFVFHEMDPSSLPGPLPALFKFVDNNKDQFINCLKEACAIQSVSAWPDKRDEIKKMVDWTAERLKKLNVEVTYKDIGMQTLPDGSQLPLPPVLFGYYHAGDGKKTALVYGHLDVQPALKEDGWDTEPFVLTEKDGKLYARGSTDDKGPVLCWLHALQGYIELGDVPVNIKFVFEGMEEVGSDGLDDLLIAEKDKFLTGVDCVCIADNYWVGTTKPCITYGIRGIAYFYIEVECASMDLHSGVFGGAVNEALADLVYLLNLLVDKDSKILIPGIYDEVAPLEDGERDLYTNLTFDVEEFRQSIGSNSLAQGGVKEEILMHRWRYPSLSIHGIEGAFSDSGAKTVIPKKVIGKFSIRLVPNQLPEIIKPKVLDYINKLWADRGSKNTMKAYMGHSGRPWKQSPDDPNFVAGRNATKYVYGMEPDLTREGGSIPVTLTFEEQTGKCCMLLPIGRSDDGAHSQNEKIDIVNYIQGTKLLGAYLYEVSQMK